MRAGMAKSCSFTGGFTLIELLVSISIMVVVTAVLSASIAGGLRVWEQTEDFGRVEGGVRLDMEIFKRDIMNSVEAGNGSFVGEKSGLSLVTVEPGRIGAPVGVVYDFSQSAGENVLVRERHSFPDGDEIGREKLFAGVNSLSFSYGSAENGDLSEVEWSRSWSDPTSTPLVVRIDLDYEMDDEEVKSFGRTIYIQRGAR